MKSSDLQVRLKSTALQGLKVDFVVSAGIASIEAPKVIRELRRHGAEVRVVMTPTATQFVQELVFEWASTNPVVREPSGQAPHISEADFVCIYPCTLDFLAKVSLGLCDSAASTLVQSALGRKPIFAQCSMHESLRESPSFKKHSENLKSVALFQFLEGPFEEQKYKALEAEAFVDQVCHFYHSFLNSNKEKLLLTSGPTRSYFDDVRYLSNYSSGALGKEIALEFYRRGHFVHVISGPAEISMPAYIETTKVESADEMRVEAKSLSEVQFFDWAIFAAAVLDFEFEEKQSGKISSKTQSLQISLKPTQKLISEVAPKAACRVGFKLESKENEESLKQKMRELSLQHQCQFVVGNLLSSVSATEHEAVIFDSQSNQFSSIKGKRALAQKLWSLLSSTKKEKSLQNQIRLENS